MFTIEPEMQRNERSETKSVMPKEIDLVSFEEKICFFHMNEDFDAKIILKDDVNGFSFPLPRILLQMFISESSNEECLI